MEIPISKHTCPVCAVMFWITESHEKKLKESHKDFYCPNGHGIFYPNETDLQKPAEVNAAYRDLLIRMKNKNNL